MQKVQKSYYVFTLNYFQLSVRNSNIYKKAKKKEFISKIIIIVLIFSIFTSYNNLAPYKNSFGEESSKVTSSLSINGKQQQQQNVSSLSLLNLTNKNISLSDELTTKINQGNPPNTENFNITKGYKIEPILWNVNLAGAVTFDNKGNMYIAESGATVGGLTTHPRILKLDHESGNLT